MDISVFATVSVLEVWLLLQYHCWKCGGVYCSRCIEKHTPLAGHYSQKPVPVCKGCYKTLQTSQSVVSLQRYAEQRVMAEDTTPTTETPDSEWTEIVPSPVFFFYWYRWENKRSYRYGISAGENLKWANRNYSTSSSVQTESVRVTAFRLKIAAITFYIMYVRLEVSSPVFK